MAELTGAQVAEVRRLRAAGRTCPEVAAIVGCTRWTVGKIAPGYPTKVANENLREAFLCSPLTAYEVARRLGWVGSRGKPESERVLRTLGLKTDGRHGRLRQRIERDTAEAIAEALGLGHWELDEEQAA